MKFCHIAPTKLINIAARTSGCHLVLAHLIEKDKEYVRQYKSAIADYEELFCESPVVIMDNSGFEYYKEHGPGYVFDPDKLLECATEIGATHIVLPDYPGEPGQKTIEAANKYNPKFVAEGFKTFFVPQSKSGDLEDYISTFAWAASGEALHNIDYIGVSILGVPIAYGVEQNNKLQRYLSRFHMMKELYSKRILQKARDNRMKIHFLGMVDGPNEISLVSPFKDYIDTWDSSSAAWAAVNGVRYDNSPSGLINGKIETAVDFSWFPENPAAMDRIQTDFLYNSMIVQKQVNLYKETEEQFNE